MLELSLSWIHHQPGLWAHEWSDSAPLKALKWDDFSIASLLLWACSGLFSLPVSVQLCPDPSVSSQVYPAHSCQIKIYCVSSAPRRLQPLIKIVNSQWSTISSSMPKYGSLFPPWCGGLYLCLMNPHCQYSLDAHEVLVWKALFPFPHHNPTSSKTPHIPPYPWMIPYWQQPLLKVQHSLV